MSWLARSISDSLRIEDDTDTVTGDDRYAPVLNDDVEERERGMKEDLTEFRQTLTRQLRSVAGFLVPVDSELTCSDSADPFVSGGDHDDSSSVYARISTATSDQSEIGVFYPVMSRILDNNCDNNRDLNELGFGNVEYDVVDEEDGCDDEVDIEGLINEAGGLTDEVLTFAGNIAHHPETWLDFPVEDEEDLEDFPMSESQKKHALAIEHLTPRLAALRIELCPVHMNEGFFWKVYFVLLHSRLNKQDAELLSTPEVVEARTKWMQELHKQDKKEAENYHVNCFRRPSADLDEDFTPRSLQNEHSETLSSWTVHSEAATSSTTAEADSDYEKQLVSSEVQQTNIPTNNNEENSLAHTDDKKTIITAVSKMVINFDDDDDDDWPEDDCLGQNAPIIPVGIDDEVSFSDLEDDACSIPVKSKAQVRG